MTAQKEKIKKNTKFVKRWILLTGLLGILVGMFFLVPQGIKKVAEWNKPVETVFEPVFSIQPEQVISIDVRGQGDRVSLEWQNDAWQFTHPVEARANTQAVRYFLEKICHWIPERKYSVLKQQESETGGDAFGFKHQSVRYVLQDQTGKKFVVTSGGQEKITNRIFARIEQTETVYLLPKIAFINMTGLAYRLRDHHLFIAPLTDTVRINFREGSSAVTLERTVRQSRQKIMPIFGEDNKLATVYDDVIGSTDWMVTYPYKIPANQEIVALLLETMSNWEVIQFVEESVGARTNLSKYGLSDSYGEISFLSADGRYPRDVDFGRPHGEDGPVFVKTSMNSKIFKIRKEALQTVQSLFNEVPSRQLVYFLEKIAQIEVLTSRWRIAMVREDDVWGATVQERLSHKKKRVIRRHYQEKEMRYSFGGEGIIEALLALEYIDTLNKENPFYAGFFNAKQVVKFLFFKFNGNLMEVFKLFKSEDSDEIFYLQRQSDNDVYLINNQIIGVILTEIKKAKARSGKKK